MELNKKRGRLLLPYCIWFCFYLLIKDLHNSNGIQGNVQSFIVLFVSGKIAAPFYYIIVLWQLTLITPMVARCIYYCSYMRWCLHFIMPIALGFNYFWNSQDYIPKFISWRVFFSFGLNFTI